eukprot:TRINITY_DN9481_c0_g2_i5.p1 TRINITY_DN9481_c0_g2~~TRINITY_DN9481_c0_g2_i5.p1  ORF type:complete len:258 (-),score=65.04 TRINITY_DN9481_c0_g2_i5:320-1054(-)
MDDTDDASPAANDVAGSCTGSGMGEADDTGEGKSAIPKHEDEGKAAYAKGDYAAAIKAWNRSLQSTKYMLDKGLYAHDAAQQKEVEDMELKWHLNLAQAHLKQSEWTQAVSFADKALGRDSSNTKALYRKASALMELLSFKEAAEVWERLLNVEPGNSAAKSMLAKARRSATAGEARSKKMSQKMFASIEADPRVPPPPPTETCLYSVDSWIIECTALDVRIGNYFRKMFSKLSPTSSSHSEKS